MNEQDIAKLRMQAKSLYQQGNKDIAKSFNDLITAYEKAKEELDLAHMEMSEIIDRYEHG